MAVTDRSDELHAKTRQVMCLVEEAVAAVSADGGGVVGEAIDRIAARRELSGDEARELLQRHAARYGHPIQAIASAVVRFDLDIDDDLGA